MPGAHFILLSLADRQHAYDRSPMRADDFRPLDPEIAARWASYPEPGDGFVHTAGIAVEELRTDYARMTMPFRDGNKQMFGLMHGGAVAALIDTVVVPAVGTGTPEGHIWSTIELHVQYHRPLRSDAVAEGWVVKRGGSIVFTRVEVVDAEGRLVASGSATYAVSKLP